MLPHSNQGSKSFCSQQHPTYHSKLAFFSDSFASTTNRCFLSPRSSTPPGNVEVDDGNSRDCNPASSKRVVRVVDWLPPQTLRDAFGRNTRIDQRLTDMWLGTSSPWRVAAPVPVANTVPPYIHATTMLPLARVVAVIEGDMTVWPTLRRSNICSVQSHRRKPCVWCKAKPRPTT